MMPFPGGVEAVSNGTLILSAVAAFLYLMMLRRSPSWRRTVAKTAAVTLLAMLAWFEGGPLLLVAALGLSAAGDAFLAREGERPFLSGLASFLAAHLAYVALFVIVSAGPGILAEEPWRAAIAVAAIASAAFVLRRLWPVVGPALRMPILAYVAAIVAMCLAALTTPAPVVALGAVLFMASDTILAVERFLLPPASVHRTWTGPAVWLLYYAAQALITLGFLV